jgi:SPASM domain peptide maturase of grasp-with-spasm system
LTAHKNKPVGIVKSCYENKYDPQIDSYFDFLMENNLGFECSESEVDNYPDMDLLWECPTTLTNAIIDLDAISCYNLKKIIGELNALKCKAVEIRIFHKMQLDKLSTLLNLFESTVVQDIQLILCYDADKALQYFELCEEFPRINLITYYASPFEEIKEINHLGVTMMYIQKNIDSASHCGIINPSYFNVNLDMYLEALNFNSCLNRKISVDSGGFIKNCPSMSKSYGHSSEVNIADVVKNDDFKALWFVNKDQVNICRDCEFRYICTDCRAFTQDLNVSQNKPLKCSYDPYQAKWGN